MKRYLSLFMVSVFCIISYSAQGWENSFSEAMRKAQKDNRMILIDFYTDWCGWCTKLSDEVFSTEKFSNTVKEDFVLLKLNADKYKKLSSHYRIFSFPTIIIINKNGMEIDRVTGYAPVDEYVRLVKEKAFSVENFYNLKNLVLHTNNDNRHVYFRLGENFYERRYYDEAFSNFMKAVDLDPNYGESYIYLGNLSYIFRQPEKADYYYELAKKNIPGKTDVEIEQAMNAYYNKYFAKALSCFDDILKDKGLSADNIKRTRYYQIVCHINMNNNDVAMEKIESLEKDFPDMTAYTSGLRKKLEN